VSSSYKETALRLSPLADRLECGHDPLTTVEADYAFAESAWDAGYFRRG
jgi:hypothetical protein